MKVNISKAGIRNLRREIILTKPINVRLHAFTSNPLNTSSLEQSVTLIPNSFPKAALISRIRDTNIDQYLYYPSHVILSVQYHLDPELEHSGIR